jgi:predicted nuclease of predicted toxin-antitoxin system
MLREAGHHVVTPAESGTAGADDEDHLGYAIQNNLTLLTKNPSDFLELHEQDCNHPGILAIHQDNDIARDMTYGDIVQAIALLEKTYTEAGASIAGTFHDLNDWRPPAQQSGGRGGRKKKR